MDDAEDHSADVADPADRSLVDDIRQLAGDARTYAEAELSYQRSLAALIGGTIGAIAGRIAFAAALIFFALMAVVLGSVLALTPMLSAWGATAAVVLVLLLSALACGLWARARWRRLIRFITDAEPPA